MPRFSTRRLALSALSLALAGCTAAPQAQLIVTAAPDDATSPFSRAGSPSPAPSVVDVEVAPGETVQLPDDFPAYTITAEDPSPGTILLSPNAADGAHPSYLLACDERGRPLFTKRLPDKGFNFQKHVAPDGSVRYSYLQTEGTQLEGVSTFGGTIRLLDASFNEIDRLSLLPHGDHGALPADLHEFVYLDDHHYLLTSYEGKHVTNVPSRDGEGSDVAAAIIQEVQDGRVVFEWDSTEHPEFYENSSDFNDYTNAKAHWADYMHMNSVAVDPADDNLIVSFRHQDQVVKLDRHTGEVLWRLGGKNSDFPLTDDQKFSHQHFARLGEDGSLSLFDNGNATQATRLVTLAIDAAAKTVTSFDGATPETRYSFAMGSYQRLGADTSFVGWGARGQGPTDATELKGGTTTFTLTFTNPTYESYRALKYLN